MNIQRSVNYKNGIITPGIPTLPHGTERYIISPNGSRTVRIVPGDEVRLINHDGCQPVEIIAFDESGRNDLGLIGLTHVGQPASGLQTILKQDDYNIQRLKSVFKACHIDPPSLCGVQVFNQNSPMMAEETFTVQGTGWVIIVVPQNQMNPFDQDTSSDIILYVTRAEPEEKAVKLAPPDPLYDPLLDINIQPGNAITYSVKAGNYLQILDVQGRECSDFQVFTSRGLDQGREIKIDPTTTRSLVGSLYPNPGLYAKYFANDHTALLEIIHDSCGRHDTFGLACTSRYYDDIGYPGHVNCSDNINNELATYGVKPREGWATINFFFNTLLDDNHAIGMDDPWSRPGDYVLLRALTDLVCVSTACPCDVDPANGWNPTDIQIRTYDQKHEFKPSIYWRKTMDDQKIETKKTGFHQSFEKFTRNFIEYNGYWLASHMNNYGAIKEYWACREKAIITDLSPLRKYEVTGPDAEQLMNLCVTRNMSRLAIGEVVYTAMCYDHGGMIDDGTIFRLGEYNFRWVGGNDDSGLWLKQQALEHNLNAWVRSSTDQLCNVAVQGRISCTLLNELFWTPPTQTPVDELAWFHFTIARLGDFHGAPCLISRTGYSGELGYEVFCHPKDAEEIFDAIWALGEPQGLVPMGLDALDMLRIEAGLIFAGYEFDDTIDPFEAGIGFTVPLKTKQADFISKPALQKRKESPHRKLVGLELSGNLVPAGGSCLRIGKAQVGEITSAVKSPILEKVIALARVDIVHSEIGMKIEVGQLDGNQKRLEATVCPFPHFDLKKERVKGHY